jgi:hypothetical protein
MWRHFEGPEAARRAHERGYAVIEEPFTPEELCSRLSGLLVSPRNDACAELQLDDCLIPREDEVFATRFKKKN